MVFNIVRGQKRKGNKERKKEVPDAACKKKEKEREREKVLEDPGLIKVIKCM